MKMETQLQEEPKIMLLPLLRIGLSVLKESRQKRWWREILQEILLLTKSLSFQKEKEQVVDRKKDLKTQRMMTEAQLEIKGLKTVIKLLTLTLGLLSSHLSLEQILQWKTIDMENLLQPKTKLHNRKFLSKSEMMK